MLGFWQIWGAKWRMSFAQDPVTWISSEIVLQLDWGQSSNCSNLQKPLKAWNLTSSRLPWLWQCSGWVGWLPPTPLRGVPTISDVYNCVQVTTCRWFWFAVSLAKFPPKNGRTYNFGSKSWIQDEDSSWRGASWMLSYMLERFFGC